jgi:hypothetical protein
MPEENLEIVLKVLDAVNRRDRDAFMACLHTDVEWREESGDPFPGLRGIYRGRAFVDGKAARREIFLNRDEALEAAGLSDSQGSGKPPRSGTEAPPTPSQGPRTPALVSGCEASLGACGRHRGR